ncbi:winged helix-turn-helix transcriptional regulator [Sphingopyxis fribergensis]
MSKENYACGIGPAFEAVGGKWKAVILWELDGGALRFGELKRRVAGASEKMLIQQLRALEQDGLVIREVFPQVPPHVEYSLSAWGVSLNKALGPIADWGEAYAKATGRYPD